MTIKNKTRPTKRKEKEDAEEEEGRAREEAGEEVYIFEEIYMCVSAEGDQEKGRQSAEYICMYLCSPYTLLRSLYMFPCVSQPSS